MYTRPFQSCPYTLQVYECGLSIRTHAHLRPNARLLVSGNQYCVGGSAATAAALLYLRIYYS